MSQKRTAPSLPFAADVAFQAGDIVFATDRSGLVVYWNKEAEEVSGYRADEVLGKPYTTACRMETDGEVAIDLAGILSGRDFAGARRCCTRSGHEVALYLFATAGRNQAGEAAGVVFVGRDVTTLWNAESELQASADKYRVLFGNTPDAVAIADLKGKVVEANPAYLRLYGYTPTDVRGKSLLDAVASEDRSGAARALASLAAGKRITRSMHMRRKDGTGLVVDLQASTTTFGGEQQILWVTRDVSERVRSEQARSQSERLYRTVFESANDAVFIETVDGRILDANHVGCELLGYSRNELTSMTVGDLVPAEARVWLQHVTDAVLRDGSFRSEALRVHKDGRRIPVEVSASTMELDGRNVVLEIVRDITRRKQSEQALRESEEKFRTVSEQSPNMIFINSRGRVAYTNQKSVDIMGYAREEFYAPDFDFLKLIAPESVEQIKTVYARHARGEEVEPNEYTLVTKDGRRLEAIITTSLIDYDGTRAILGIVTDITERKRAERALREEKERSQKYLELAGSILVALDASGHITLLNRRGCQVLGVSEAEALGRDWFDSFVPERSRAEVKTTFAELMAGNLEPVEHYDNPVVTAWGEERLIAWHNSLLYDQGGRPTGTLSSGDDVTEREQVLAALRESEDRYRTMLETSPDGVAVYQDGRIVLMNPAGARMLGYDDPAKLEGMTGADFLHPDDEARVLARMRQVLESGPTGTPNRARYRRRDGSYASLEVANSALTWHGKPTIMAMFRDVTEREKALAALRESEEKYRSVVERASDGICVIQDGRLWYVNQRLARMVGYEPGEIVGTEFAAHVHPDDRPLVAERYRARLAGEQEPAAYSIRILLRGGGEMPVEVNVGVATYDGAPAEIVLVRDVTERTRAERALRESEERFRAVAEQSPNMIFINREGHVVYVNRRCEELLGFTSEELRSPGFDFMSLVAPESTETVAKSYARRGRGEDVEPYEHTLVAKDGRRIPALVSARPIDYGGGRALLGVVTDIGGLRAAEQALRESERQYRTALEAMRDPVHVADADLRIVMVNRAFTTWLRDNGLDDAVLGKTVFEAFPFLSDRVREEYRRVFATGETVVTEEETSVAGRAFTTETTKMPVTEHGKVVRVLTAVHDVTERKRLARAAQETADELRAVLDNSPGAIAGESEGVLVYANQRFAQLFGYDSAAEIIGRPAGEFDALPDRELLAGYGRLREQGKEAPTSYSFHGLRRDGTTIPLEATISTYRSLGRLHILASIREAAPGA